MALNLDRFNKKLEKSYN